MASSIAPLMLSCAESQRVLELSSKQMDMGRDGTAATVHVYVFVTMLCDYSVGCHSYIDDHQELSFDWFTGKQDC